MVVGNVAVVSIERSAGKAKMTETSSGSRKRKKRRRKSSNPQQHNGYTALCSKIEVMCLCLANAVAMRERAKRENGRIEMVCECRDRELCNRLVKVIGESSSH